MSSEAFHHRGHYGSLSEPLHSTKASEEHCDGHPAFQIGDLVSSDNLHDSSGSGWVGASFNLTSSIVGAGCIGLGGAIANSGGLISFVAIVVFAVLSKYSFDLIVDLTAESSQDARASTYEDLGYLTYGRAGKMTVIISKGLYSFGCLVAYIVIVKDNFAFAISHLLYGYDSEMRDTDYEKFQGLITNQYFVTIFFCTSVMLPLCMLRDVTPLERFSALKITVVLLIVVIVIYLFVVSDNQEVDLVDHWMTIHDGVFER